MAKKIYKRLDIHGAKSYSPKFENFTFPRKKISNSLVVFKNFKELQSLSIESCDWPMWLDLRWQMTNLLQWVHRITVSTVIILYVLSRWIIHILQYLTTLNFFSQLWTIVLFTWPAIRFDSSQSNLGPTVRCWSILKTIEVIMLSLVWLPRIHGPKKWTGRVTANIITKNTASLLKLYKYW